MRMRTAFTVCVLVAVDLMVPRTAFAQRFPFEQTLDVSGPTKLDVSTLRGKIEVTVGAVGRVVVNGDATVRVGWDVPTNAAELARSVAAAPPIERDGNIIRLRIPADSATQRAVTISYRVQVPPDTDVHSVSNSGETSISGVAASVDVRTQSGAIDLKALAGVVLVFTGSGAVSVDGVNGALTVTTSSSAFRGTGLGSSLRLRTRSGDVGATFVGPGDVDVETGSSAIRLSGVRGGAAVKTQSGRVTVQGVPSRDWVATTGSSSVDFQVEPGAGVSLDASSRSGSVVVEGETVRGSVSKRAVKGEIGGGGGSVMRIRTGSGSIRVRLGVR